MFGSCFLVCLALVFGMFGSCFWYVWFLFLVCLVLVFGMFGCFVSVHILWMRSANKTSQVKVSF